MIKNLIIGLLISFGLMSGAFAQQSPLVSPPATAPTQPLFTNNTFFSTTAFTNNEIIRAKATIPISITGGTYNIASNGTGLTVVVFNTGTGPVSSILAIISAGSGYAVGDVLFLTGGNMDAVVRVNTIGGGGSVPATGDLTILYGGTGYVSGLNSAVLKAPVASAQTVTLTGTLTSNATLILENGTYNTASTSLIVNNNTTGNYTVSAFVSNGSGGTSGSGIVIPQGSNNSCATIIQTDGVNDVWDAAPSVCTTPVEYSGTTSSIGGGALTAGACTSGTVSIAAATTSMGVVATPAAYPGDGIWWEGYVSSAGTVTVKVCAAIAATPSSTIYNVRVLQ